MVMTLNEAVKMGLQAAVDRYKLGLDKEMERVAEVQLQKDRVDDELFILNFSLQRAENNQMHMLALQELAQAKLQLRSKFRRAQIDLTMSYSEAVSGSLCIQVQLAWRARYLLVDPYLVLQNFRLVVTFLALQLIVWL
ncbi:hypothetical protein R1sor_010168 [Riccia sorocarpa]|uniref:Uncharacterized protein n=1 Tax=Riccia sorocarpa TaxID=122646 RepID=A0ABD3HX77_9MARC